MYTFKALCKSTVNIHNFLVSSFFSSNICMQVIFPVFPWKKIDTAHTEPLEMYKLWYLSPDNDHKEK